MCMRCSFMLGVALVAALSASGAVQAQTMTSPDSVKRALTVLNRVKDHTGRLVAAKNYAQLAHENEEFKEGAEALQKSIAAEPREFKGKVEPLLKKALDDSQSVTAAGTAHDDAKMAAAFGALTASVKSVIDAFPASVQPTPPAKKP